MDKCRERHLVHYLYPVGLIWLTLSARSFLALQRRPHSLPQDENIGNPLNVLRIVLQDEASGKHGTKLRDEIALEWGLYPAHVPPLRKSSDSEFFQHAYLIPSIIVHVFFAILDDGRPAGDVSAFFFSSNPGSFYVSPYIYIYIYTTTTTKKRDLSQVCSVTCANVCGVSSMVWQ